MDIASHVTSVNPSFQRRVVRYSIQGLFTRTITVFIYTHFHWFDRIQKCLNLTVPNLLMDERVFDFTTRCCQSHLVR